MPASSSDDLQFLTSDINDEYNDAPPSSTKSPMHYSTTFDEGQTDSALKRLGLFRESKHPGAAFFHVLFKALALFVYFFAGVFTSNFVLVCVVCILLLAFDFWAVKNVTGRLLVGLRWWNYVKEDGSTEWVFESQEDMSEVGAVDRRLFWWALYTPAATWGLLLVLAIIQLKVQWLIVIFAALSLSSANIIGYTKCSKEASARLQNYVDNGVASNIIGSIGVGNILSGLTSVMGGQQQQQQQQQQPPPRVAMSI